MKLNFPKTLLIIFGIVWLIAAFNPMDTKTWVYENIAAVVALPFLVAGYYRFRFSNVAYGPIFVFAVLHITAAYYSYGGTPWGLWLGDVFGRERNNYDRIVHFLFGFLMAGCMRWGSTLWEFLRSRNPVLHFSVFRGIFGTRRRI